MPREKETWEQMRNNVTDISLEKVWDSKETRWEPLCTNGENMNTGKPSQEWSAYQECINNSSRKSEQKLE